MPPSKPTTHQERTGRLTLKCVNCRAERTITFSEADEEKRTSGIHCKNCFGPVFVKYVFGKYMRRKQ